MLVIQAPAGAGAFVDAAAEPRRGAMSPATDLHALLALAYTDDLTNLPNRRFLQSRLHDAVGRSLALAEALSILVLDIDRFKRINDRFGHSAGDQVLIEFAKVLRATSRASDVMGRWGGEEFLYILPGTLANAKTQAERLREAVAAFPFGAPRLDLRLTVSIGVTEYRPGESAGDLIDRADRLLYRAKGEGRDRAIACDQGSAPSRARRALTRP